MASNTCKLITTTDYKTTKHLTRTHASCAGPIILLTCNY